MFIVFLEIEDLECMTTCLRINHNCYVSDGAPPCSTTLGEDECSVMGGTYCGSVINISTTEIEGDKNILWGDMYEFKKMYLIMRNHE